MRPIPLLLRRAVCGRSTFFALDEVLDVAAAEDALDKLWQVAEACASRISPWSEAHHSEWQWLWIDDLLSTRGCFGV